MAIEGVLLADRSHRGKLRLTGPEALWFLDQLLTNQVEGLEEGRGCETLLLTHNGKIQAHGRVLNVNGTVYFDYEPPTAPVFDFLSERVFATKVEIENVTDDFAIIDILGQAADDLAGATYPQLQIPGESEHDVSSWDGAPVARVRRPAVGLSLWSARAVIEELTRRGATVPSVEDLEALRAIDGYVLFGQDFDSSYLPQEASLERAVHFSKGCYLGQEAVAMVQRGRAKRKLRRLVFDEAALKGEIRSDGHSVGEVTSVGRVDGRGLGIGTVSTAVPVGSKVEVVSDLVVSMATVQELPGAPSGPGVPSARELRERLSPRDNE